MRQICPILLLVLFSTLSVWSPRAQSAGRGPVWQTRLPEAVRAAENTGRPILAFFNDSVECPWCAKLRRDVFDSPQFQAWAGESVVLLDVDFPTGATQDEEVRRHNESLKQKFAVRSYPMVVFITPGQKEIGRIPGYPKGAKSAAEARDKWLTHAKSLTGRAGE